MNDHRPVNPNRDARLAVLYEKPLIERLPKECEAVVQAALTWVRTDPTDLAATAAALELLTATQALKTADSDQFKQEFDK